MTQKIRVGAVSYLNTKPLIYGFEQGKMKDQVELIIDYPANIASQLINNQVDIGLVPVAVIPFLKEHHVVSPYGIACEGEVASVCLFSEVPMEHISHILLDYQSRTSVALLKILLRDHWKISPQLIPASSNYEKDIAGTTAGLVIGDRALVQRTKSTYIYDLGTAWKEMTGLPFVFAAWISNKKLPQSFIDEFSEANAYGFDHLDEVIQQNPFTAFDLHSYYTDFIKFRLNEKMFEAVRVFFSKMKQEG